MASGKLDIDAIEDVAEIVRTMQVLNVSCAGLRTIDEMKSRLKETLNASMDKCNWTAGKAYSVLTKAQMEDTKKREKLMNLYEKTERCLQRLDSRLLTLLNQNIGNVLERIANHRKKLKETQYYVLVAGETSAGKSSLLNLILGEELLPYSILSTTSTICELKYGKDRKIVAHFKDKDPETGLSTKAFPLSDPQEAFKDTYLEQIAPFVHVKSDRDRGSTYKKIELFWPHPVLQSGIVIVDSPGIGESEIMDAIVTDYLPEAFAFIYVINSANAGGVQKDRLEKLLEEVRKVSLEGKMEFPSECALFICNKWDQVSNKEKNSVRNHVVKRLKQCWPNLDPKSQVIRMSTTDALKAQSIGIANDEFSAFMNSVESMILKSIETRLKIHWKWLDNLLSRIIYHTRAFVQNAARDRDQVVQRMAEVADRLYVIEKQQSAVIAELKRFLEDKVDSAIKTLSQYLLSNDVRQRFYYWTLDDAPKAESSWTVTENAICKALERRFQEFLVQWEEENHVFAEARHSLIEHFVQRYNLVEGQLRNLEDIIVAEDSPIVEGGPPAEFTLPTYAKVFLGVTSPLWVPLSLVGLLIALPALGIFAIKEKLEDNSKNKWYENDRCGGMVEIAKKYLDVVTKNDNLREYVKGQLEEARLCLKQIKARIPALILADKILCRQLIDETRSQKEIQDHYGPLMERSTEIRGRLAMFRVVEIRQENIESEKLEWQRNDSSCLGIGAFAAVYKGKLKRNGEETPVALKVWNTPFDESNAGLFLAESSLMRKLNHRHIVTFYGTALFREEPRIIGVLVMEMCKTTLKRHIFENPENVPCRSKNHSAKREAIRLAKEISDGLDFIHKQGIVHRDLKMDNILLSDDNIVKITDVGIAKEAKIITGTLAGTPAYIAPEVFNSKVYNTKADIYSFGLILWEMWYGKEAYHEISGNVWSFFLQIDAGYRPSQVEGCKAPPSYLQRLMEECWAQQPEKRLEAEQCLARLHAMYEQNVAK